MRKVRNYYEILKPCPKCGSKHLTVIHWKTAWFTTKFQVECYDCGYKISSKNKGRTLKKWGINNNKYEDKIDFTFVHSNHGDWEGLYANGKLIVEGHCVRATDVLDAIANILPNNVEHIYVSEDVATELPKYLKDLNK